MFWLCRVHLLPEYKDLWAARGSCNPSFSTDNEESKLMYLVLESSTNKPVFSHCTCTVGYVLNSQLVEWLTLYLNLLFIS